MAGRTLRYQGRRVARGVRRSVRRRQDATPAQSRRLLQLVICGGVFVTLVALKLLFPEGIAAWSGAADRWLGQDSDFVAAFSAVGRAIAGEEEVSVSLQEAYTAVFAPGEYHLEETSAGAAAEEATAMADRLREALSDEEGLPLLLRTEDGVGQEVENTGAAGTEEDVQELSASAQSYTFFSLPLPDKVSMTQQVLGFSYTTPAQGTLTSTFGWREHPIYGENRFHYGLDIAAAQGTEIDAFAQGTVKAVGESSSLGKYLMIDHQGGYTTLYAHCSKVTVSSGQEVAMGEKVAEMGSTGVSTGPHLHFEIHSGSIYLNPIYYVEVH